MEMIFFYNYYNRVQTNDYLEELVTWKRYIVYQLLVLDWNT